MNRPCRSSSVLRRPSSVVRLPEAHLDMALEGGVGGAPAILARIGEADGDGVGHRIVERGLRDEGVVVAPLAEGSVSFEGSAPCVSVLVTDPEAAPLGKASLLRRLYGVSESEARLAERLALGDTPAQAAASLGIKTSTARTQLISLFRKTETSRQAELIRVMASVFLPPRIIAHGISKAARLASRRGLTPAGGSSPAPSRSG